MDSFAKPRFPSEELLQSYEEGWLRFPQRSIGKVRVPPKAAFFSRCVALSKIRTANNLRRGIVMEWFFMCKSKYGEY